MNELMRNTHVRRLIACLFGGFVLALMVGNQEGSQTDFGISFSQATSTPRLALFLLIGLGIFALLSFRDRVMPYLRQTGSVFVVAAFLVVLAAMVLMNWYDPVGKFSPLAGQVAKTSGLGVLPSQFFGWLGWTLWFACLVLGLVAVIINRPLLGYVLTGLGVVSAVIAYIAHQQVVAFAHGIDHSLGVYAAVLGYALFAVAGLVIARVDAETSPRAVVERVMAWRPGFPAAVAAAVLALVAFSGATWFSPLQLNLSFAGARSQFRGTGLAPLATTYLDWLGVTVAVVSLAVALAATYLRSSALALATVVLGVVGLGLTVFVVHALSSTGARVALQYGKLWQNLGAGGWVVCIAYGLVLIGGVLTLLDRRGVRAPSLGDGRDDLPVRRSVRKTSTSSAAMTFIPLAAVMAIFYPPTLPVTWQNVIVTQIGVYILLAVGLNVVVGWAGLLDLGYIAFYGIGSYTTAYLVGSLPLKPPTWLHLFSSPLWAIPFAIVACLIAGVLLGAPTLRLRGDYLAIVTLGFGEIIQVVAINNPGNLTGGPQGPNVPHPVLDLGLLHITWGLDNLPYWYLLLFFIGVVVILFYRLEGSRLGRAWAAIREDEVAAQATGINTTKAKLLAFAIGASTSGLAGVFFATQVGYFDPSQFTLQNSILIVAYVVFGGMGSLPGAIAGAAVLTWLPQFLKAQVPLDDRQMWIGALVLIMMIFRPAGLIPARRRAAELHGLDAPSSAETVAVPASEGL